MKDKNKEANKAHDFSKGHIKMRVFTFLFLFILGLGGSVLAHAESKPLPLFWSSSHWVGQDYKPYLEDSRIAHSYRWEDDDWSPQEWVEKYGSKEAVMEALKSANIVDELDTISFWQQEQTPVLEVGYAFNQISNRQKRHVLKFVDYAYHITSNADQGVILIEDDETDVQIGIYTKLGLQLN